MLPNVVLSVDECGRDALVGPRLPVGEPVADGAQEQQVRVTVTGQGLHFVPSLRECRVELVLPFNSTLFISFISNFKFYFNYIFILFHFTNLGLVPGFALILECLVKLPIRFITVEYL